MFAVLSVLCILFNSLCLYFITLDFVRYYIVGIHKRIGRFRPSLLSTDVIAAVAAAATATFHIFISLVAAAGATSAVQDYCRHLLFAKKAVRYNIQHATRYSTKTFSVYRCFGKKFETRGVCFDSGRNSLRFIKYIIKQVIFASFNYRHFSAYLRWPVNSGKKILKKVETGERIYILKIYFSESCCYVANKLID